MIYKEFKEKNKAIMDYLEGLSEEEREKHLVEYEKNSKIIKIQVDGAPFNLTENHVKFERTEINVTEEKYMPGVIEPSFGIGRILYCVLEHCSSIREKDEKRTVFNFPPVIAPYKVSVLPLIHTEEILKFVEPLSKNIIFLLF